MCVGSVALMWRYVDFRRASARAGMYACIAAILVGTLSIPATAQAQPLLVLIERSVAHAPDLAAEQARQRGRLEQVPQAVSAILPKVNATGSISRSRLETKPADTRQFGTPASLGLSATQLLYDNFKTVHTYNRAQADIAAGREGVVDREQNVLLDTITIIENYRRDLAVLALRKQAIVSMSRQLLANRKRFEAGEVSRTDVAQTESRQQLAIAELAQAESELAGSSSEMLRRIGALPASLQEFPLPFRHLPPGTEQAIHAALGFNPALHSARFSQTAAEHGVQAALADAGPTVHAEGQLTRDRNPSEAIASRNSAQIGVRVNLPILDGGLTYSRAREARATAAQRQEEARNVQDLVIAGVRRTYGQLRATEARIAAAQRQVRAAETALRGLNMEAQVGERSIIEALDAEREVVNARVGHVQARRDRIVSAYALIATMGHLRMDTMRAVLGAHAGSTTPPIEATGTVRVAKRPMKEAAPGAATVVPQRAASAATPFPVPVVR